MVCCKSFEEASINSSSFCSVLLGPCDNGDVSVVDNKFGATLKFPEDINVE
jgi:hypothetical protein